MPCRDHIPSDPDIDAACHLLLVRVVALSDKQQPVHCTLMVYVVNYMAVAHGQLPSLSASPTARYVVNQSLHGTYADAHTDMNEDTGTSANL